jgi:hypothetical protein
MRRKRLKHSAHVLCQIFCGWQLYDDWDTLAERGSGLLVIDLLQGLCRHNDEAIADLHITDVLLAWLVEELQAHNIPLAALEEVRLEVEIALQPSHSTPSGPGTFAHLKCGSHIHAGEVVYTSTFEKEQEWLVSPDVVDASDLPEDRKDLFPT